MKERVTVPVQSTSASVYMRSKVFTHALHDFLALTESTQLGEPTCQYSYFEKGQQKNVLATIPNGNLGYDQYAVLDPVAVESNIVAFL